VKSKKGEYGGFIVGNQIPTIAMPCCGKKLFCKSKNIK
jgi:hypothetical protein